jgi:hypothetical protein
MVEQGSSEPVRTGLLSQTIGSPEVRPTIAPENSIGF